MRRIYFVVPDYSHARRIVAELEAASIPAAQMHTLADNQDLAGLPPVTAGQRQDRVWLWERLAWNADLAIFFLALLGLGLALYLGSVAGAMVAAFIMLTSFVLGERFATVVPHAHLDEVRAALAHGEIVLMVDVPKSRVREVEQTVTRQHPETAVGGIGWTLPALGT
jgi:hypothetical protein